MIQIIVYKKKNWIIPNVSLILKESINIWIKGDFRLPVFSGKFHVGTPNHNFSSVSTSPTSPLGIGYTIHISSFFLHQLKYLYH